MVRRISLLSLLMLCLAGTGLAQDRFESSTREVRGPSEPFARQMTGHAFSATTPTSPSSFMISGAGNFQAQAFPRAQPFYVRSFQAETPSFKDMQHTGVGGLTETGVSWHLSRSWIDSFMPFDTGKETWVPTNFVPPPLPEDRPYTSLSRNIGQRVPNGPSWIYIDLSKEPATPHEGFQSPLPSVRTSVGLSP
ncbi:MAG TPA: hypothetical protein VL096_18680 [Pirellulaceae bacterium]|nr:hypothetical protein [Pirellulaceae bacterium]